MALTNSPRRVVVTGVGLVTACGNSTVDTWNALVAGRGGVGPITSFDASAYSTRFGAEVRGFEPLEFMDAKDSKRTDRTVHLAMAATRQALAGVEFGALDRDRIGVVIGSGIGGIATFERQHSVLLERGPDKVSPFFIPMMISDMASGYVSIAFGLKGPNYATVRRARRGATRSPTRICSSSPATPTRW
jgi:3-oxoacyl-[acyl-carrier-protein] synthase II